jgi:hypothetical protein
VIILTEIPLPGDFESVEEKEEEEEKGCCDRLCECWCQLLIIIIAIAITLGILTSLITG